MENYTVYFLVRDIIGVTVSAESDKEAKEKAEKRLNKEIHNNSLEWLDGTTKFAGLNVDDVWTGIDD